MPRVGGGASLSRSCSSAMLFSQLFILGTPSSSPNCSRGQESPEGAGAEGWGPGKDWGRQKPPGVSCRGFWGGRRFLELELGLYSIEIPGMNL